MKLFRIFIRQNPWLNSMLFIIALFFNIALLMLILNLNETKIENRAVKSFENQQIYQISDDLVEEREVEYYEEKDSFKRLNDFNVELNKSKAFKMYTARNQPMEVVDFKGDATFSPDYNRDFETPGPNVRNGNSYYTIKTMLVNSHVLSMNHIQLSDGKLFSTNAYEYDKNKVFPILLGSDYQGIYHKGETIRIAYFFTDFKAEIIGFLKKDEKIMTNNDPEVILNDYMVMPVINFSKLTNEQVNNSEYDRIFYMASLDVVRNSQLITASSSIQIRKDVAQIANESGFSEFSIIGADGIIMDSLYNMSKVNIKLIILLNIIIIFIVMMSVYYVLKLKVKYNQAAYLVLLVSGLDYRNIKHFLYREIAYVLAIATVVSFGVVVITSFLLNDYKLILYFISWAIGAFILLLVSSKQLVNKAFKNIDVIQMLKRG